MTDKRAVDVIIAACTPHLHRNDPETGGVTIDVMIAAYTHRFRKELSDRGVTGDIDPLSFDRDSEEYLMAAIVFWGEDILYEMALVESGDCELSYLINASLMWGAFRQALTFRLFPITKKEATSADLMSLGASFAEQRTARANRQRSRKKIDREKHIIAIANKLLRQNFGRFRNGSINKSKLADACLTVIGPTLKRTRVRQILSGAIRDDKLTE